MKQPRRGLALLLFARCDEATRIDSDGWEAPVSLDRWWAARLHRLICRPCRHEHRVMQWLARMLNAAPTHVIDEETKASKCCLSHTSAQRIHVRLMQTARGETNQEEFNEFL